MQCTCTHNLSFSLTDPRSGRLVVQGMHTDSTDSNDTLSELDPLSDVDGTNITYEPPAKLKARKAGEEPPSQEEVQPLQPVFTGYLPHVSNMFLP